MPATSPRNVWLGGARFTSQRRRKDNVLVDVEIFGVPLVIAGRPRGILALYQDVTGRRQAEAERAERHRLATLAAEVGLALTGAEDLSEGLQQCVDALIRNTDIAFAQIWTGNEKEHRLELQASADIQLNCGPDRLRMDRSRLERIAETGVTQLDNAFAGYPLKVREQVLGVAAAFSCQPLTEAALPFARLGGRRRVRGRQPLDQRAAGPGRAAGIRIRGPQHRPVRGTQAGAGIPA